MATVTKRSARFIMKEAIQQHLKQAEVEQTFISAGVSSWQNYKSTELHITFDEAKEWAKKLSTDCHANLPACHP